MMHSLFITLGFVLVLVTGAPDNQGTQFVIGFMENYAENYYPILHITTTKATSVSVTVTSPKYSSPSLSESFSITRGDVRKLTLNKAFRNKGSGKTTKGILVSATDEVIVYGVDMESHSIDGYLGIPMDVIGSEYYITTYAATVSYSQFLIVGVTDSTSVTIRFGPNTGLNVTYNGHNYYKNDQMSTTIHSYECLQIQDNGDMTATYITSNKAIAVFSGNKDAVISGTSSNSDHIIEQHIPTDKWGKTFVTVPTPTRTTGDYFRFIASEFDTTITVTAINSGSSFSETFTIDIGGKWVEKLYSSQFYSYVTATKPIYVVQYVRSQETNGENGDPAMIILPPIEQYAADYSFTTPQQSPGAHSFTNYLIFICKNADKSGMRLNGNTFLGSTVYNTIPGTDLVGGYLTLTDGTYTLRNTDPTSTFGGYLVGLGFLESYGMPFGFRLAPINTVCSMTTQTIGDGLDNDCDGLIDEENCDLANNFADDDGDGKSEEDCANPYPIDGGWIDWEAWGPCSCVSGNYNNGGTRKRKRSCTNPAPQYNGVDCSGNTEETDTTCSPSVSCTVNGEWTLWSSWGSCTVTCGSGTQSKTRTCTDPSAANGGSTCSGDASTSQSCNTQGCPVDGSWTPWSAFTSCDYICGAGTSNRTRTCTDPAPANGGNTCLGDDHQSQACTGSCMVDGNWGAWEAWGSCTLTCGSGVKARIRRCTNPAPSNGGQSCSGSASDIADCNTTPCPTSGTAYVQACPTGWFTCQSGGMSCIAESFKCDCAKDCDDGSDETVNYAGCTNHTIVCSSANRMCTSFLLPTFVTSFFVVYSIIWWTDWN